LVLTEPHCDNRRCAEQPDAIGWTARTSIVVECKTSLGDLAADRYKPHRQHGRGLGQFRYYMIPQGLEVGEIYGWWGLLECRPKIIRVIHAAPDRLDCDPPDWNAQGEVAMLARMLYWALEREEKP